MLAAKVFFSDLERLCGFPILLGVNITVQPKDIVGNTMVSSNASAWYLTLTRCLAERGFKFFMECEPMSSFWGGQLEG